MISIQRFQQTTLALALGFAPVLRAHDCDTSMAIPPQGEGWVTLFDGAPDGLPPSDWVEVTAAVDGVSPVQEWRVEGGILIRDDGGSASTHLYYVGSHGLWTDMELICEFRTEIGTNSDVLFRVDGCQPDGTDCSIAGANGLEAQINNTSTGATDHRTGAFFPDGNHLLVSPVEDN